MLPVDDFASHTSDRDSLAKLGTHPQWSLVPVDEFYQSFVSNADHRCWWHNYGLVIGRKDSQECSLPEHITPHAFADATRFGFTDYEKEGIPVEYEALLRLLPLEFPDGRVKVVNQ